MGKKILVILFIVVAFGIVLYVASSHIFGKLAGSVSALMPHLSSTTLQSGVRTIGSASPSFTRASGGEGAGNPSAGNSVTVPASSINPADIPSGYTLAQLSPFFHKIKFGTLSPGNIYSYGEISLSDSDQSTTTIDVTGWQIKSNRGDEYIPTAVNLYDPSGLTPPTDILLSNGQTLNIYSNTSHFNLRLNECIGYVQNVNPFNPALPMDCPYARQSDIASFTGLCQQYILSLGSCAFPDMNNASIPQNDYACRSYLDNLNYGGCFAKHVNDADFLSNEWRVWTGSNVIDPIHDTVLLLDRNGLLVDMRTY